MTESSFQLKGSVVTVVVLELHRYHAETFTAELEQKIRQAPQLLGQSPVVFDLEKFSGELDAGALASLLNCTREQGLQPVGFRDTHAFNDLIRSCGIALLPAAGARGGSSRREPASPPEESGSAPGPVAAAATSGGRRSTRLVSQPVRSGQQIYAQEADLIVTSQVSEGAELLADGNIHVYGGLRGRALAGVRGDTSARIFCQRLDAELLSVAGNFVLSDDIQAELRGGPVQVYLGEEGLRLDPIP